MVWDDRLRKRRVAPKNDLTAMLTTNVKAQFFQRRDRLLP